MGILTSYDVAAKFTTVSDDACGVLIAQGRRFGGWVPTHWHNWVGCEHHYTKDAAPVPAGEHTVRMEFNYHIAFWDSDSLDKGSSVVLLTDDRPSVRGTTTTRVATPSPPPT